MPDVWFRFPRTMKRAAVNQDDRYRVVHARITRMSARRRIRASCGSSADPLPAKGSGRGKWQKEGRQRQNSYYYQFACLRSFGHSLSSFHLSNARGLFPAIYFLALRIYSLALPSFFPISIYTRAYDNACPSLSLFEVVERRRLSIFSCHVFRATNLKEIIANNYKKDD